MKLKLLLISVMIAIAGCSDPSANEYTPSAIPKDLLDCSFYKLKNEHGVVLHVVRCPLSSTSAEYRSGKTAYYVSTIEDL